MSKLPILPKDELYDLYINQNLSKLNVAKHFNVCEGTVSKNLENYKIVKSKELMRKSKVKGNVGLLAELLNRIDKDEFIDLYINQNKDREFIKQHYNIKDSMLDNIINSFDCHKSRKQSSILGLNTKYEKAGGKDIYFKQLHQTLLDNLACKGISEYDYYKKVSDSCKNSWCDKSKEEIDKLNDQRSKTCLQKYGYAFACMRPEARCHGNDSSINRNFYTLLNRLGLTFSEKHSEHTNVFSIEFPINRNSYDFKIGNTLIELNPTATHNSTCSIRNDMPAVSKDYHYNKTKLATDNGYRCICVWDWDDTGKVISLFKDRSAIYARKCEIHQVTKDEERCFLDSHHIQNYVKSDIALGLYYDGELVSIMTFGKPRYNKKYEYELLRYCSTYNVTGGSEKLFKYFVNNYNPKNIISYCDLSKFTGETYEKLGFSYVSTSVGKHWYNMDTGVHITDNLLRQRGFDQLLGNVYGCFGKGTSNEHLMLDHGFVEVYDCGQATYSLQFR